MSEPRPASVFVALIAASLASRALLVGAPTLSDEAAHLVGSWTLLDGGRLYVDFVDNKPPLLYAYFAAAQELLGRGIAAVRLLTFLLALPLTGLAASAFFGHDRRGRWAGLLFVLVSASYLPEDALAVHVELLMLVPAAWAFVLLREPEVGPPRAGAGGVLLGLAALFKPTAALWLAAPPLGRRLLGGRYSLRALAATVGGFLVPLGATALVFWRAGQLPELLEWTVLSNVRYVGAPLPPAELASRALRLLVPWVASTAVLWWAYARARREGGRDFPSALVDALVVCAAPAALLGGRFYGHYFLQVLFPLCLGAAPSAARLARRPVTRAARLAGLVLGLTVAGFGVTNAVLLGREDVLEETFPLHHEVAAFLRADPCRPGATVFVWGLAPRLYVEVGLPPASRFVLPQETISGHRSGRRQPDPEAVSEEHRSLLLADLRDREATYIVDLAPSGFHRWDRFPLTTFPGLLRLVREQYELAGVVEGAVIHRRRGCAAAAGAR